MILIDEIVRSAGLDYANLFYKTLQTHPAQFYLPNRAQADLIRAVGSQTPGKRIYLVTSGNGVGKTTAAINICLNLVYPGLNLFQYAKDVQTGEEFPGFFNYYLYRRFPVTWPKQIWYISNRDAIVAIEKKFKKWVKADDTNFLKDGKAHVSRITFTSNDWEIQFKTIDQDPATFETADVSVVIFDEPPPYRLFTAAVSRLREGGIIIIPATPLFTAAWFVDEIIEKADADGDKYYQKVNVWTNCVEEAGEWDLGQWGIHPKGNLYKSNIDMMIRNWDVDELEARRDGEFKYLTGLVFKSYSKRDRHHSMRDKVYFNPTDYMYRMTIDPHERRPPAVIWECFDRWNRRHVLREWPSLNDPQYNHLPYNKIKDADPLTISDFVKVFAKIEKELNIPQSRIRRIMDPNFGNKPNRETGRTVAEDYIYHAREQLGQEWTFLLHANNDLYAGHEKIKELLKPTVDDDLMWTIEPDCQNIDWCFRHYSYDELTAKQAEKKELAVAVREIGKDFIDCVRYSAMIPMTYEELNPVFDPYEKGRDYGEVTRTTSGDWRGRIKRPEGSAGV